MTTKLLFLPSMVTLALVLSFVLLFSIVSSFELKHTILQNRRISQGFHHHQQLYSRPKGYSGNVILSSNETAANTNSGKGNQVYVRFSPLIGGPKFLPIHVEVMFLDYINTQKVNDDDGTTVEYLHRFDFLPAHPNDDATIMKLLSLQSVSGLVRHRILLPDNDFDEKSNIVLPIGDVNGGGGSKYSIVPSERIAALIGKNNDRREPRDEDVTSDFNFVFQLDMEVNDIVFTSKEGASTGTNSGAGAIPVRIPKQIETLLEEKNGMELHLLFNNCYTFALDVLKSLKTV